MKDRKLVGPGELLVIIIRLINENQIKVLFHRYHTLKSSLKEDEEKPETHSNICIEHGKLIIEIEHRTICKRTLKR